ncbi:MAG: hypothetical protein R3345_01110 [Fulvivirga sp.]|nr:hypothetical protein [Fulvivirga sp.]
MISPESIQFLQENDFIVTSDKREIVIDHNTKINWTWPVLSIFLALLLIPLLSLGNFKIGLLILLLLIVPVYKTLHDLKQPKRITITPEKKVVSMLTKNNKRYTYHFDQINEVFFHTFDEHKEPNAFQDEVVVRHYYIDLNLDNEYQRTILAFEEPHEKLLNRLINELNQILGSKKAKAIS